MGKRWKLSSISCFLEHIQYKKDATQLKNFLALKLPPFPPLRVVDGKKAAISKLRSFSTESRRSYIDCTLVVIWMVDGSDKTKQ